MDDEAAIRALHAEWGAAARRRDVAAILELVTDDCVFLMPGAPPIIGKNAVRVVYAQMFERWKDADIRQDSVIDEIEVAGNWAFWRGSDTIAISPPGGPPMRASGYGMGIVRREGGRWRFARGINNMTPDQR
jgi:uncharacterized protein (TIGR02246 family)